MEAQVVSVEVDGLTLGLSPRARKLDPAHVAALVELAGRWPPILVRRADRRVIDGHHRVAAARRLGLRKMAAAQFDGSVEQAFVEAVRRNVEHGLPLTFNERKAAARRLISDQPQWSDRCIAQVCALSPRSVGKLRGTSAAGAAEMSYRIGRDGRGRPVRPESTRSRIIDAVQSNPDASLRTIAQAVGASPETVRRVRQSLEQRDQRHPSDVAGAPSQLNVVSLTPIAGSLIAPSLRSGADSAVTSTPDGKHFADWFDRTGLDTNWRSHALAVPLSRVYEVADEARRRARDWSEFADLVERRAHASRAGTWSLRALTEPQTKAWRAVT
jgi:ParB-like chromosome segregation protein Spo0J